MSVRNRDRGSGAGMTMVVYGAMDSAQAIVNTDEIEINDSNR